MANTFSAISIKLILCRYLSCISLTSLLIIGPHIRRLTGQLLYIPTAEGKENHWSQLKPLNFKLEFRT